MKLILFDVDMTLVSTGGAGLRALNRAFEELLSLSDAMSGIAPHGMTDPAIVRQILANRAPHLDYEPKFFESVIDRYVHHLETEVHQSDRYRVLPGILSALDALDRRSDVLLGLATGNVERGARIKLERGQLNRYFDFGGYGSDSEARDELVRRGAVRGMERAGKPIRPTDVIVVGDTPRDVAAAKASGYRSVGVATGHYSVSDLDDCGADLTLADFEQDAGQFLRWTFIE